MKKILLPLLIFILAATTFAQTSPPERRDYKTMIAQENTPPTPLPVQIKSRTGTGLNDFKTGTVYNQTVMATFVFTISHVFDPDFPDQPDQFDWTETGGSGDTSATAVDITGASQTINDGFSITFPATAGHVLNNTWTVKVFPVNNMYWAASTGVMMARWSNATTTTAAGGSSFDPASPGPIGGTTPGFVNTSSALVYDPTASTGTTTLTIRRGAGQSNTNLLDVRDSGGSTCLLCASGDNFIYQGETEINGSVFIHSTGLVDVASGGRFAFSTGSDPKASAPDASFVRSGAKQVDLTDASIGYAALRLLSLSTVNGSFNTSQITPPTIATAGTSATVTSGSTDSDGQISIVGTAFSGTTTVTYNLAHTTAAKSIVLTPSNATADGIAIPYISSSGTGSWVITVTALTGTATYMYHASF